MHCLEQVSGKQTVSLIVTVKLSHPQCAVPVERGL